MNELTISIAFDPCEDVEHFWNEDSGKAIWVVSLPLGLPGQVMFLDGLEFHIEEAITPDDMAQEIFSLTGGLLDQPAGCGMTEHMLVYYDSQWPGRLALEVKTELLLYNDTFWLPSFSSGEPDERTPCRSRSSAPAVPMTRQ